METRAHYVLIGLFTVAITAGAMLFALWLAKTGDKNNYLPYDIVFREAVSGLSVGNAVEFSGIRVGEVKSLHLDPQDSGQVWARVNISADTPVKQDTRARLALANITGASNIQLTSGSPDSPPLVATGDEVPRIMADPSPFVRIKVSSEEMFVSVNSLIDSAKQLLSQDNIRHVSGLIANLDTISGTIAEQKGDIRQAVKDVALAGRQAEATAQQAAQLLRRLNQLVDGRGNSILTNADKTIATLEQVSGKLDRLFNDNAQALGSGVQGLTELGPAIRELRQTLSILEEIGRRLEENPTGYLLGQDRIKEFHP